MSPACRFSEEVVAIDVHAYTRLSPSRGDIVVFKPPRPLGSRRWMAPSPRMDGMSNRDSPAWLQETVSAVRRELAAWSKGPTYKELGLCVTRVEAAVGARTGLPEVHVGLDHEGVEGERVLEYDLHRRDGAFESGSDAARSIAISVLEIAGLNQIDDLPPASWGDKPS